MKLMRNMMIAASVALVTVPMSISAPAMAQDSSYKSGTVWNVSRIKVLDGQFENYMDHLAGQWKKVQEFGKAEGIIVDYHVLATNNARDGEPNLVLVIEYKDYAKTAEIEAFTKKVNAMLATTDRTADKEYGQRTKMREPMGSVQYQELDLK
ncbi:hypothetical protein [Parasphingorhabdus sp.]|uniref:hypothetical protein n=1 Tax=Parasphingorhabdus sp. TaxID=2709688 RepID=UPI003593D5AB